MRPRDPIAPPNAGAPLRDIGVLFIGGIHQAFHIAPVAAELSRKDNVSVTGYVVPGGAAVQVKGLLAELGAVSTEIREMLLPPLLDAAMDSLRLSGRGKLPRLLAWRHTLARHDALLTAERTSTILKRLPGAMPPMIHIPHGAGDRAKGFERRIKLFDHVIVPGPNQKSRMIAEGIVTDETCSVSGSIKLAATAALRPVSPRPLFDNDLPTVLYNPHFDRNKGSWSALGLEIVRRFAADPRYNLIVAPHIRARSLMSRKERRAWHALGNTARRLVDLGGPALSDATYTRAADIYLGDVSSQVYEFLARPRPCVFVNAHHVAWEGDPNYLMWTLGAVCDDVDEIMRQLPLAFERWPTFAARQEEVTTGALGLPDRLAPLIAANQLLDALDRIDAESAGARATRENSR